MKTIFTHLLGLFMLVPFVAKSQYDLGASFQLSTDPVSISNGRPNLGLGTVFGVYDLYRMDYGFKIQGSHFGESGDPTQRAGVDSDYWDFSAGVQLYPFGVRDQIFFDRDAGSRRLRFHHRRWVQNRVRHCGSRCYSGPDLTIDKLLRGIYLGVGYEFHKRFDTPWNAGNPEDNLRSQSVFHGAHLELGYSMSIEFLWISLSWRPLGAYSPTLINGGPSKGELPGAGQNMQGYQPSFTLSVGCVLFN